jgi:hypothetical protein
VEAKELRCEQGLLHGIVLPDGTLEVKCHSRFCGHMPGVVVLHRFDVHTGEVTTRRYRDPAVQNKED